MQRIRIYPDPVLRNKAKEVNGIINDSLEYILNIMQKMMIENNGIGLAANQIGILEKIIVIKNQDTFINLINPVILEKDGKSIMEEGCLSLPGVEIPVERADFVIVEGLDELGNKKIIEGEKILAHVIQHEIDHLEGKLIIDKLSSEEKIKFFIHWQNSKFY